MSKRQKKNWSKICFPAGRRGYKVARLGAVMGYFVFVVHLSSLVWLLSLFHLQLSTVSSWKI
jgi:hypothetical protein